MSSGAKLRVSHLEAWLEENYSPHLDLSDVEHASEPNLRSMRLTRGLSAFALNVVAPQLLASECAAHVTDGADDNGIDALYVDELEKRIYVVQSKWSDAGTGTIALGDMHKTLAGLRDLWATLSRR